MPEASAATTTRVTIDSAGGETDGFSNEPRISANGKFVAFFSVATDLLPPGVDGNAAGDTFVRDLKTGVITRVSVNHMGGDADEGGGNASISSNGRYVAFTSSSHNLLPVTDADDKTDVFVRDLKLGVTQRVSVDHAGGEPDGNSSSPWISGNGRLVVFSSVATDLLAPGVDGNAKRDIYLRDLKAGTTTRISVDNGGADADDDAGFNPSISLKGRHVAFSTKATDMLPGGADGNALSDIYVRDLKTWAITRVTVDNMGGDADGGTSTDDNGSISGNGRYVVFRSGATDLLPPAVDNNAKDDIFVRDLKLGITTRVSVANDGGDADEFSIAPTISPDGRFVAFSTLATDILPTGVDGNGVNDVYLRDMKKGITTRVSVDSGGGDADGDSANSSISSKARRVAFDSGASDLLPVADGNMATDVYVRTS